MDDDRDYLIWSEEHHAWWRPAERGYTSQMKEAGRYSKQRADVIVHNANLIGFNEIAIPMPEQLPKLIARAAR